jgi:lysyl-tRNA synthetase, class I
MNHKNSQPLQSPHWADKLVPGILKWQKKLGLENLHVDDMKTPSGRVHTGALRGVLLHDLVAKVLQEQSPSITSTYVINDMDPMDGLPTYLDREEYAQHMGKPLWKIPAPILQKSGIDFSQANKEEKEKYSQAQSFAEFYAFDFIDAFRQLGCDQKVIWSHELYESGQMDEAIRTALDGVDEMRNIYHQIADYNLPENWYPFQVTCEKCGKVGTTLVTDWDGEKVTYECQPHKVDWAVGCGHQGTISPFGGTGKLLWKVDWPAHWASMGVNVEGAGKDHSSAGGSRDMAKAMCEQVFNIPNPFDIPYEWILIRGAKMSSSKGVGTSAKEFIQLFPPEIGRYLFTNAHYNSVIDFDPRTMSIPDLFDSYDQGARIFWNQEEGDQRLGRAFKLSQIEKIPSPYFLPRFRDLALWMQHPEIDLIEKFAEIKGSKLTPTELAELESRQNYAKIWVDNYAPEEFQLTPTKKLPTAALEISSEQIEFFQQAVELTKSKTWQPQDLQQAIYELAKESIGAKQGFGAIYLALLGKSSGPRAAWLLLAVDQALLDERIIQLTTDYQPTEEYLFDALTDPNIFSIGKQVREKFPSTTVGIAVISGVTIEKQHPELTKEIKAFLQRIKGLPVQEIGQYSEIQSYHRLYKETGVNLGSRRPSPEALLRRAAKGQTFEPINACVDAYNLIVMKNRVSAGAFNLDEIKKPTQLDLAQGGEQTLYIGEDKPTLIQKGEICYFDQVGAYNLDFNYRDAVRTQVDEKTKNLLINVEGIYDISRHQVEQSLQEVVEIIQKYCGGTVEIAGIVEARE